MTGAVDSAGRALVPLQLKSSPQSPTMQTQGCDRQRFHGRIGAAARDNLSLGITLVRDCERAPSGWLLRAIEVAADFAFTFTRQAYAAPLANECENRMSHAAGVVFWVTTGGKRVCVV